MLWISLPRAVSVLADESPEHQPTTVNHDDVCADRPRTRMPRCTPAGLSGPAAPSTRASRDDWSVTTMPKPPAWEA